MNNFIPNVIEPYPDELLFSWVKRLADANGLSFEIFFKTYFGEKSTVKENLIPIDIRRGFLNFCEALNYDMDYMDLYFQLSTAQFELSFYPLGQQTRILHTITRPESKLNTAVPYFITKPKICLECMKEDAEQYGEFFLHRSHHLSGVCACHKHGTPLYEINRIYGCKYVYDFDNPVAPTQEITGQDVKYAKYAHCLLSNNMMTHADKILDLIFTTMNPKEELLRIEVAKNIAEILDNPIKYKKWTLRNKNLLPQDAIKLMMYLYPDYNNVIEKLGQYNMIIKKHCKKCNKDYYTTELACNSGWDCVYCDSNLSEQQLFSRLVRIAGNGEYKTKQPFKNLYEQVVLYHKICDEEFSVQPSAFIFRNRRCNCNQKLIRKDAEKKMKQYPDFKLIEFNGASQPASFYHKTCGQTFILNSFVDFIKVPKCRCCEIQPNITQEEFEKRVRDIVGDEYTVIGNVKTLADRIAIKHNICGHIQNFVASEFLAGSRCPKCYQKTSITMLEVMLQEYADDRYTIIKNDNYKVTLFDKEKNQEIKIKSKHIIQELLRPTPSPILPTNKVNNLTKSLTPWDRWYQLCIDYKNEFGHLSLGHNERYKGYTLGDWCSTQRIAFNKGLLPDNKVQLLKDIDFVFDGVFFAWNKRFEEYKAYVAETGDMNPYERIVHNGNKVGTWVRNQRHEEAKGELNPVYKEILLEFNPDFFKVRQIRKKKQ